MNFWQQLPKPFLTVAPMADVTDAPFRQMIAKYSSEKGEVTLPAKQLPERPKHEQSPRSNLLDRRPTSGNPFVMWTEFVSADGLALAPKAARDKLLKDLLYSETERPIVAQLFSSVPKHMEAAAALVRQLGFTGVDINMGCPDRSVEKQGCGSAMIKTPAMAQEIIRAAKRGAQMGEADGIPVSVKTRLGYYEEEIDGWLPVLLTEQPAALTVHCRTRQDMSKVPARWDRLVHIKKLRDKLSPNTILIGNGDILNQEDAYKKIAQTGVDGAMVGRALFGNPWFFHPTKRLPHRLTTLPTSGVNREEIVELIEVDDEELGGGEAAAHKFSTQYITLEERLKVLVEHSYLFTKLLPHKSFNIMKKHYKGYVNGFPGAAELRKDLMSATEPEDVQIVVENFLGKLEA